MTKLNKTRIHVAQWDPFEKRLINQTKETYEIGYLMDLISKHPDFYYNNTLENCYSDIDILICIARHLNVEYYKPRDYDDTYKAIEARIVPGEGRSE